MAWGTDLTITLIREVTYDAWPIPCAAALEWLFPRSTRPAQRLKGAAFMALYYVFAAVILTTEGLLFARLNFGPLISVQLQNQPGLWGAMLVVAGPVIAAAIGDFFYYWTHRLQHAWAPLWRFHSIHHAIRDLNAVNCWHHWTEEIMRLPLMTVPLAFLIHLDYATTSAAALMITFQSVYIHSSTTVNFGPLAHVLGDNRTHRIHHSLEPQHWDKNFGVFTMVWDKIFGTFCYPNASEWPLTGVRGQQEADSPAQYFLGPFARRPKITQYPHGNVVVNTDTAP